MKKLLTALLILSLCVSLALPVFATDAAEPTDAPAAAQGSCGADMTWEYADGVLTITGSGSMDDFDDAAPWAAYKDEIKRVVLSGSISYIGARAFSDYDALETVNFGNSLYEIGTEAFKSCDGLTVIYLPASFKVFGESSFASCSNLTSIHCSGKFPSFRMNCLWNTFGTIYYPASSPWGVEYIEQLETAFKGRIEFLASDGTDHYQPEEVTEPVTEAPTVAPTAPPTEAPTAAPTQAPTQAPTEMDTIPATQPQTEPATEKPAETTPPAVEKPESRSWIGMVVIGAVAVFLLLGMIIVRVSSRRGRYSKRRKKR